jgi:hypothetical protein
MMPAMSMRARWIALVAVLLVAAGWLALVRTGAPGPRPVAVGRLGPMSIWPESPFDPPDALQEAQDRADAGTDRWRLRPDAVAARFAQSTFGWIRFTVDDAAALPPTGPITLHVHPDCAPCGPEDHGVDVTVDRLLGERPSTVWSVVAVSSPALRLPVEAGDTIVAGASLPFTLGFGPDRHVAAGIRFTQVVAGSDCGQGFAGSAGQTAHEMTVDVPDPLFDDAACSDLGGAGYVFAYTNPALTVQTGDPMLEPVYIADLSIVPVLVSQEPVAPSPAG